MPNKKELPRYRQLPNRVRLLIFPGSTCSLNSIPYLSYKIVGGIVIIVARDSYRLSMRMIVYTMGTPSLPLLQNESSIS